MCRGRATGCLARLRSTERWSEKHGIAKGSLKLPRLLTALAVHPRQVAGAGGHGPGKQERHALASFILGGGQARVQQAQLLGQLGEGGLGGGQSSFGRVTNTQHRVCRKGVGSSRRERHAWCATPRTCCGESITFQLALPIMAPSTWAGCKCGRSRAPHLDRLQDVMRRRTIVVRVQLGKKGSGQDAPLAAHLWHGQDLGDEDGGRSSGRGRTYLPLPHSLAVAFTTAVVVPSFPSPDTLGVPPSCPPPPCQDTPPRPPFPLLAHTSVMVGRWMGQGFIIAFTTASRLSL